MALYNVTKLTGQDLSDKSLHQVHLRQRFKVQKCEAKPFSPSFASSVSTPFFSFQILRFSSSNKFRFASMQAKAEMLVIRSAELRYLLRT